MATLIGLPSPRVPIFVDPIAPIRPITPPLPTFLDISRPPLAPILNPQRRCLSRDERLQIQTLHEAGHSNAHIKKALRVSKKQIQYTLKHRLTPQHKKCGRKPAISQTEGDRLEAFIRASKRNRRLPYKRLLTEVFPNRPDLGSTAVQNCLERRGYHRRISLRKPILSETNRVTRLA